MSFQLSDDTLLLRSSTTYDPVSTENLETSLKSVSKRAAIYEVQMRDLESRLSHHLSDFHKVDCNLQQAQHTLQVNSKRADRALEVQVERIETELNKSMAALTKLGTDLPVIRSQVNAVADVYLSGHETAKILVSELDWLNTDFYERWRRIIFTSTSPVSWRWKAIMRTLFAVSFVMCFWFLCIAIAGAYRAHRHRLVWGDKLMS